MSNKTQSENLAVAIKAFVDNAFDIHRKILPAVVLQLNNDNSVDVQILTNSLDEDSGLYKTVKMYDVPIGLISSGDSYIRLPVAKGTTGSIYVYDVDISGLIANGDETAVNAKYNRKHNLADVVFKPDFQTGKKSIAIDDNSEFKNGDMSVILHPDGKIEIKGASAEVLDVISSFMAKTISNLDLLINDQHINAVVGSPVTHSPTLVGNWSVPVTGLKALMQSDNDNLDTMKV